MKRTALPRFYKLTPDERLDKITKIAGLDKSDTHALRGGLDMETADSLVENAIGTFTLPLGVATNFRINGQDIIIPMVTEEPSVIAAASSGAKATADIEARGSAARIIGQVQILHPQENATDSIHERKDDIIDTAGEMLSRRMSVCGVESRMLDDNIMMTVDITVEVAEAMGANAVNTMCEGLAPLLRDITGGSVLQCILSNDIPDTAYARACFDVKKSIGEDIVKSYRFALFNNRRAVTHNKGIMNGISAVGLATGQDTRALEAGAHAYAAGLGADKWYGPLSRWEMRDGMLWGELHIPLRVGTVGGLTAGHPTAAACLKMLGNPSSYDLSGIMAAVGLCQNFSALRALVTDGIQKGHMKLHKRRLKNRKT